MSNTLDIAYNTDKEPIRIPEYGRSIQELILHAVTIEDDEKRQRTAEEIAKMMFTLNPASRSNQEDFRERVWNHLFRISDYQINVTPPKGIKIITKEERKAPDPIPYPARTLRFRHYGHNIQVLIEKAIAMEEGEKKDGFKEVIASYMKLAYKTWNREHYVSDDVVKDDLEMLSEGKLSLADDHNSLDYLAASAVVKDKSRKRSNDKRGSGRGRNSQSKSKGRKRSYTNKRKR